MNKPKGGKRPGAGRHSIYTENLFRVTLRLAGQHFRILAEIDPNISAALRAILDDKAVARSIVKNIIERKNQ